MVLLFTMGSNSVPLVLVLLIAVLLLHRDFVDGMALVHQKPTSSGTATDKHKNSSICRNKQPSRLLHDRRDVFKSFLSTTTIAVTTISSASSVMISSPKVANAIPEQKSYSSNARNMERLSSGDSSGGSTYNNSPDSPAAAKRRAMVGCKTSSSRVEASRLESEFLGSGDGEKINVINEKDCNMRVMGGDSEFMLRALRNLDCPTCPYGIRGA